MTTPNINDEMKATSEYAIKAAKQRFDIELDYSETSLNKLDTLLEQAYQTFAATKERDTATAIQRTAGIWGCYLGEFICLKLNGLWIKEGSERILLVGGQKISPIAYVYKRITNQPQYSVRQYFDEVVQNTAPVPKSVDTSESDIRSSNRSSSVNQSQTTSITPTKSNAIAIDKRLLVVIASVIGVFIIGAVGIAVIFFVVNSKGISSEFKTYLNSFLIEAEKLRTYPKIAMSARILAQAK